jgi:hypothetical protein
MTTELLDRPGPAPVPAPEPAAAPPPRRAAVALARREARLLLRHPLIVVAVAAYAALLLWQAVAGGGDYPVLQEKDRETQLGPFLIGLAGLLAANASVLRSHRHGTEAHFGVLVVPAWWRGAAHCAAVVPLALVVAVLVAGQFAREAARPGAVGHGSFFELATGPLVVLLLGVLGVLLGRLVRSAFAGPVAVLVMLAQLFTFAAASSGWARLIPLVFDEGGQPLPSDLVGRPASWHALYLVGLTLLAGVAAMLAGSRGDGGAWRVTAVRATALGACVAVLLGGAMQVAGPSDGLVAARERATNDPGAAQECVRREATTYCAFPEFTPWIDEWRVVADEVRALSGAEAAAREFTVRQRVDAVHGPGRTGGGPPGPPGEVTVGTAWGGEREMEFAASVARGLVVDDETEWEPYCDARGILITWLAIRAVPDGEALFAETQSHMGGGGATILAPVVAVTLRDREYAVVRELLDAPAAEIAERVKASWEELTAPGGTSTERAAGLLGVSAPAETAADRQWACS